MNDILVLFPPQWRPTQPYLSLPYLTAFLRENGFKVKQIDVNAITYNLLLSAEMIKKAIDHVLERKRKFENKSYHTKNERQYLQTLRLAALQTENLLSSVDEAKEILRRNLEKFSSYDVFLRAYRDLERALRVVSAPFYPTKITLNSLSMKYSWASINDIMKAVKDEKENPFIQLFQTNLLHDIMDGRPTLIGISVVDFTQIIPAFTLANLIKKEAEYIKIVIGGSLFSHLAADSPQIKKLFDLIDFIIKFDGEVALRDLALTLEQSKRVDDVPNIIYKENNGRIKESKIQFVRDIDVLPFPVFDGFPMDFYFSPATILPILSSRGCYWGKCAYCIHKFSYGNLYRQRKITKVVEELSHQMSRYNTRYFSFNDEMISPKRADRLSKEIIKENLDIAWHMNARPEEGFTKDKLQTMFQAGCRIICWGLESYCQRVLNFMERGTKLETIKPVFEASTQAGIWNSTFLFFGFPTETREEAQKTIDFVLQNNDIIQSVGAGEFRLYRDSNVYYNPTKYEVSKIVMKKDQPLALWYEYKVKRGMHPKERLMILSTFIQRLKQQYEDFEFWHYIDREHMLIYLENKWHHNSQRQMRQMRARRRKLQSRIMNEEYQTIKPQIRNQLIWETPNNKPAIFIYDPCNGASWLVNAIEFTIIALCNGQNSINDIALKISKKYYLDKEKCSKDIQKFVKRLIENDLIHKMK
ncbi:MAG: PqqD family peptide modification chaperone [Candidatus Bathyarchaeota archaeon]|nr:MAG: PqqD family peptide modification chaperone [Candidatus Bathyarchaeota archaeon]